MKTFAKILVLGFAVAVTSPLAFASPIPIQSGFNLTGQDNDAFAGLSSAGSVTFGSVQTSSAGTGFFTGLGSGTTLNFVTNFSFYGIPTGGQQLFTFTEGADNFVFMVTTVSEANGTVNFYGDLLESGAASGTFMAYLTMTNLDGALNKGLSLTGFDGYFGLLPEPSSLLLMATGLIGMAMLLKKRRMA